MAFRNIVLLALLSSHQSVNALKPRLAHSIHPGSDNFQGSSVAAVDRLRWSKRLGCRGGATLAGSAVVRGGASPVATVSEEEAEFKQALVRVAMTVSAACLFGVGVYFVKGRQVRDTADQRQRIQ
jgi:hypothetical protein